MADREEGANGSERPDAGPPPSSPKIRGEDTEKDGFSPPTRGGDDGSGTAKIDANEFHGRDTFQFGKVEGNVTRFDHTTINFGPNFVEGDGAGRYLDVDCFEALGEPELRLLRIDLCFELRTVMGLAARLEENRILVVYGAEGLGKASLALLAAETLWRRQKIQGVLRCTHLEADRSFNPWSFFTTDRRYARQLILFEDACQSRNASLERFCSFVNQAQVEAVRKRLVKTDSYIVFTTPTPTATQIDRFDKASLAWQCLPPRKELLLKGFHRMVQHKIKSLELPPGGEQARKLLETAQRYGSQWVKALGSFPRLRRLVEEQLQAVAEEKRSATEAQEAVLVAVRWLIEAASRDREVWLTTVALTLASARTTGRPLPALAFHELRRRLDEALFGGVIREGRTERAEVVMKAEDVLQLSGAEQMWVKPQGYAAIRFREPTLADQMWSDWILRIGPLAEVLSLLQKLAQEDDWELRSRAVIALGRLARIDPLRVARPLLRWWIQGGRPGASLASLFLEGALANGADSPYVTSCLNWVSDLLLNEGSASAALRTLRAALGSRPEALTEALELAFKHHLRVRWQSLGKASDLLEHEERRLRSSAVPGRLISTLTPFVEETERSLLTELVPQQNTPLLGAVQSTLADLFQRHPKPSEWVEKLTSWMECDPQEAGAIITVLFLRPKGVAQQLAAKEETSEQGSDPDRILDHLDETPGTPQLVGDLVCRMRMVIKAFPKVFADLLDRRFWEVLAAWGREGARDPNRSDYCYQALWKLFRESDPTARQRIVAIAQHRHAPELAALQSVARRVLLGLPAH